MAHQIESNRNFFSVDKPAWHGLGTVLDAPPTSAEALDLSGQDYTVAVRDLFSAIGERTLFDAGGNEVQVPYYVKNEKAKEIYRTDNGTVLGVCGNQWTPLQNKRAFEIFDPLVTAGKLEYVTAGTLGKGERCWILAKPSIDNVEIKKGDEVSAFVLLSNAHTGKHAVRVGFTPIRVVCANTLAMAISAELSKLIRVRHNSNVDQNVEQLVDAMDLATQEFKTTTEKYQMLANTGVNANDMKKYFEIVLDLKKTKEGKLATRGQNILDAVVKLACVGRGVQETGSLGTWWGAYNAVTEYLSYEYGRSDDSRMNSLWFGQNATKNKKALDLAVSVAGGDLVLNA